MRSRRLVQALVLAAACGAFPRLAIAQQVGGSGGGPFDDTCRPGDVMVGYNVVSGKAMNTFAAVCQAQRNGTLVGKNYGLRTWGKDDQSSGIYHELDLPRCPAGAAVSRIDVWVNKFNELDSVAGSCSPLHGNAGGVSALKRTGTAGGQAVRQESSGCPAGMIAVGVTGRSGALMDAVGLKCAPTP